MLRRMRLLLPPAVVLVNLLMIYVVFEILSLRDERPRAMYFVAVLVFLQGSYRVFAFHPLVREGYRRWLLGTPWTIRRPLPLGPVWLLWEDVVLIGLIALACMERMHDPQWAIVPVSVFLFSYLLCLSPTLFRSACAWPIGYLVLFGLGLAVRFHEWPAMMAGAFGLTWLVATLGLRRSLSRFRQWTVDGDGRLLTEMKLTNDAEAIAARSKLLGWPYDRLAPTFPSLASIAFTDSVFVSLLAGWWFYVVGSILDDLGVPASLLLFMATLIGMAFALGRLAAYCQGYKPPISTLGRLATLRWIIPGYDKVFLAPLLSLMALGLVPMELYRSGVSPIVATSIGLALCIFLVLTSPPSLLQWRLTGRHRVVADFQSNQSRVGQMVRVG